MGVSEVRLRNRSSLAALDGERAKGEIKVPPGANVTVPLLSGKRKGGERKRGRGTRYRRSGGESRYFDRRTTTGLGEKKKQRKKKKN